MGVWIRSVLLNRVKPQAVDRAMHLFESGGMEMVMCVWIDVVLVTMSRV